jgi:hypothetical protein
MKDKFNRPLREGDVVVVAGVVKGDAGTLTLGNRSPQPATYVQLSHTDAPPTAIAYGHLVRVDTGDDFSVQGAAPAVGSPSPCPTGGVTSAKGMFIAWQNGPLGQGDAKQPQNGAMIEDVIKAAMGRLDLYETACDGKFACEENKVALQNLRAALGALEARTFRRQAQGVEGTAKPHMA